MIENEPTITTEEPHDYEHVEHMFEKGSQNITQIHANLGPGTQKTEKTNQQMFKARLQTNIKKGAHWPRSAHNNLKISKNVHQNI